MKPGTLPTIIVLHGDQTGEELLQEALRVIDPSVVALDLKFEHYDLSLANRRTTNNGVVLEAAKALRKSGLGIKAATITPEERGDVGSPNAILRKEIKSQIILRSGRRLPKVRSLTGAYAPITIVRMATGDAYGAEEWRETTPDDDEFAYRTTAISRKICRAVAEFSFDLAKRTGACVFGGPKYTVSPIYEGMFKEELDAASERHPDVEYQPQLIDTTFALLLKPSSEPIVIPALNRDGDLLSDMVLQMFGSIAGAESLVLAFNDETSQVEVVMAEAPHGTAPTLEGKNIANPIAMILAGAALLRYIDQPKAERASQAIYESVYEAVNAGKTTTDLEGHLTTTEFTDEIIERVASKLEAWKHLS